MSSRPWYQISLICVLKYNIYIAKLNSVLRLIIRCDNKIKISVLEIGVKYISFHNFVLNFGSI
jgi:hypothetical protein